VAHDLLEPDLPPQAARHDIREASETRVDQQAMTVAVQVAQNMRQLSYQAAGSNNSYSRPCRSG
jgi:hypothetical protein